MSGNRFGGIGDRLLERVSGGDAAGQVGKAHAVARAFVLVYQCDVACHRLTAFAAIEPSSRMTSRESFPTERSSHDRAPHYGAHPIPYGDTPLFPFT